MSILDYTGVLAEGLLVTLQLTLLSAFLACVIALAAGLARLSRFRLVRWTAAAYVEFFRGTSCYIQLYWLFFALPLFGIYLDAFLVGAIAIALNVGSFGSEVVRGSLLSVPREQVEAAIALNLTRWQRLRTVILPQALVTMLPPATNLLIELVKITPLVSLITIADLTFVAQLFRQQTGETLQAYGTLMVIYFIIATSVALPLQLLEKRVTSRLDIGPVGR